MVKKTHTLNFSIQRLLFLILLIAMVGVSSINGSALAAQQETGPTYIIQQGDTLNEIAIRFGITTEEIIAANAMDNPNALFIGQSILIPGLEGITGVLTSETIPLGVSLTSLVRQNRLKTSDLVILNRLTSPSEVIAGASFIIPVSGIQDQMSNIPSPEQGGTLLETAIEAGVSPWALVEDNQLLATWDVLPGERLFTLQSSEIIESAQTDNLTISINSLPLIQGETLQISITTPEPVRISGSFDNQPLYFFSDDGVTFTSFHGIHALAEPGVFPLQIKAETTDGTQFDFDQLVLLASGFYSNEWVTIDDETYLNEVKIAEENAYVQQFLDQTTLERHWEGRFQFPVDEPHPSSEFGLRRDFNNGKLYYYHTGVDFIVRTALNLNIYATAAGVIILAEEMFTLGNAVYIDHGWGVFSGYAHLEEILVDVGDFVQPGDLIGIIGNTGRSAGSHLHFEIIVSGTPVNPLTWLNQTFP